MAKDKLNKLIEYLKELGSVAVAFSGGVDSTLLLDVAHQALGDQAIAITAVSEFLTEREHSEADEFCREHGIKQIVLQFTPLAMESIVANPPDRCYICKKSLFTNIEQVAAEHGVFHVADGSNVDDLNDYRPGMKALEELEIISPLRHVGLTKEEIRQLSKERNLPTWNKPAFACLASRLPYGEPITKEKLRQIEKGEEYLRRMGLNQFRVRVHDNIARIEVEPQLIAHVATQAAEISSYFKSLGFTYVSLDLGGYRTGSMNEVLPRDDHQ